MTSILREAVALELYNFSFEVIGLKFSKVWRKDTILTLIVYYLDFDEL